MSLLRICLPQNFRYQPRSGCPAKGIATDENFSRRNTLSSNPSHRRFVLKLVVIVIKLVIKTSRSRIRDLLFDLLPFVWGFSGGAFRLSFGLCFIRVVGYFDAGRGALIAIQRFSRNLRLLFDVNRGGGGFIKRLGLIFD